MIPNLDQLTRTHAYKFLWYLTLSCCQVDLLIRGAVVPQGPILAACMSCYGAGFSEHKKPLTKARVVLDDISHELPPSDWLEEQQDKPKPLQQLGTLGGGDTDVTVCF